MAPIQREARQRSSLVRGAGIAGAALLLVLGLALAGCSGRATEDRAEPQSTAQAQPTELGPSRVPVPPLRVVLFTLEGLRLDALTRFGGSASVTPNLERLHDEADFVGVGVAASSFAPSSLASLWTGLQPLRHGVWGADRTLASGHFTLAEWFAEQGFSTLAWRDLIWLQEDHRGFSQGFEEFRWLLNLRRIGDELSLRPPGGQFVWVGLRRPGLPYERDERLFDQLREELTATQIAGLPKRITLREVAAFYDPSSSLPSNLLQPLRRLELSNLARADRVLGAILRQLEEADALESTLVVLAGTNGESLGEGTPGGNVWSGSNLGPSEVLVPVLAHLPRGASWRSANARIRSMLPPPESSVPLADLAATLKSWLVELEGLAPAALPAMPTWAHPPAVALAELWRRAGGHQVAAYGSDSFLLQTVSSDHLTSVEGATSHSWSDHVVGKSLPTIGREDLAEAAEMVSRCEAPCTSELFAVAIRRSPAKTRDSRQLMQPATDSEVADHYRRELWRQWLLRNSGARDESLGGDS